MEQVDPRRSLINALITLGVVTVLAFVGFIVRLSRGETIRTPLLKSAHEVVFDEREEDGGAGRILSGLEKQHRPTIENARIVNRQLVHSRAKNPLLLRKQTERFEVLVGCELLDERASTASKLWLVHHGREFVAHLYFAESPNPIGSFALDVDIGAEAADLVRKLLKTRTTRVFTRWQPVQGAGKGNYYVMVYVEGESGGDRRFLSEILVAHGLADPKEQRMLLPDGKTRASRFVQKLYALESRARAARQGAWRMEQASVW